MACDESKIVGVVDVHIHFYTVTRVVEHEEKVAVFHLYDAIVGRIGYFLYHGQGRSALCSKLIDSIIFPCSNKMSVQLVFCLCIHRHCNKQGNGCEKCSVKSFHRAYV